MANLKFAYGICDTSSRVCVSIEECLDEFKGKIRGQVLKIYVVSRFTEFPVDVKSVFELADSVLEDTIIFGGSKTPFQDLDSEAVEEFEAYLNRLTRKHLRYVGFTECSDVLGTVTLTKEDEHTYAERKKLSPRTRMDINAIRREITAARRKPRVRR